MKAFTHEQRLEILNYAKKHGVMAAAKQFNVHSGTIKYWNDELHIYTPRTRRGFTDAQKIKILQHVLKDGVSRTANKFGISPAMLSKWNAEFKIYETGKTVVYSSTNRYLSDDKKQEILKYVQEHGISKAAREYNVSPWLIQVWNASYKVYKTRRYRRMTQKEKLEILKYAEEHSILAATKKYDVADGTIRSWIARQKNGKDL